MRVEGNRPDLELKVMNQANKPSDWFSNKYGQKVRPYELSLKIKQADDAVSNEQSGKVFRIEYLYSMKNIETKEAVYEREPHRVMEIQDPILYRGDLSAQKSKDWKDTHKVFIVNGRIDKLDGNFLGGFFFNKIKDTNIIIGSYPLSKNDLVRMQKAGVTSVLNIQTGSEMTSRGVFWPQMVEKYKEVGINTVMSYPISDKNEDDYIEELFNAAQHVNDLI